jgi:late competence protein required for DNA uptake (superfamily II DNA/RNA helicase)
MSDIDNKREEIISILNDEIKCTNCGKYTDTPSYMYYCSLHCYCDNYGLVFRVDDNGNIINVSRSESENL